MEIDSLGDRLRRQRVAAGRTIASVSAEAGLSVPYIANLENGRGNPTLSAVNRLAAALGVRLTVDDGDQPETRLPATLVRFAASPRFAAEVERLAGTTGSPATRERVLSAMAAMGALAGRPLSELDWHRILDTVVLITRA